MPVESIYDRKNDVLYVRRNGSTVGVSREHPNFTWLIRHYDYAQNIVGVQVLRPTLPTGMPWKSCTARYSLPKDILAEIDRFMEWMESGDKDPEQCAVRHVPPDWMLTASA